jgi:hypothetical protein
MFGQATSGIRYQQPLMATDLRGQRSRGNFHDIHKNVRSYGHGVHGEEQQLQGR